jgi:putative membrane protein
MAVTRPVCRTADSRKHQGWPGSGDGPDRAKIGYVSILIRVVINAVALWAATLLPGVDLGGSSTANRILTLVVVAIIFGLINAILKPLIKTVGCAFYVLTLGLISLVVNALLFLLLGWVARQLELPFTVDGWWPAFFGAIVVGVVSFLLSVLLPDGSSKDD